MKYLIVVLLVMIPVSALGAQEIYDYKPLQSRWATAENPQGLPGAGALSNGGRKGRASVGLKSGESVTLAETQNSSGTVRRIWIALSDYSPVSLRSLRIQFFWDGAVKPAIDAPLGDFFGIPLGQMTRFESAVFSSPEGRSLNCFLPMPFHKAMKIVVTNEGHAYLSALFYEIDYTLGDTHGKDMLYLHAWYHSQDPTTQKQDYEILPKIYGKGRFVGSSLGVIADGSKYGKSWWGEGEVKIYLDHDLSHPTLAGTGTEDYIGDGWGMHPFSHQYEGCTFADEKAMRYGFYRFHVPDPIYFATAVRVTIQQIGWATITAEFLALTKPLYAPGSAGIEITTPTRGRFERQDAWSSVAYFYLDTPTDSLPGLVSVAARVEGLPSVSTQ